jgi:hypothetical protein
LLRAEETVRLLDAAQDVRALTAEEATLRHQLKSRILGLSVIERIRIRQRSRVCWLRAGDANTRFFHVKANGRRRKNFIHSLRRDDGPDAVSQEEKRQVVDTHFHAILGTGSAASATFDWAALGLPTHDLSALDADFTLDEIHDAVKAMPADKAPGPDGFISNFFKSSWELVGPDILLAFQQLADGNFTGLHHLNVSHMVLLPKCADASSMKNFRPISLMHSFAKLFMKVLASRLATRIDDLVGIEQSAFIKGRCIQDNFIYVRALLRRLHRSKTPSLLLKLDISKAFDSVSWTYLLDMLRMRGFGPRWRNWIAAFLSTASSRVLFNGEEGASIAHRRGLRQGDPYPRSCSSSLWSPCPACSPWPLRLASYHP